MAVIFRYTSTIAIIIRCIIIVNVVPIIMGILSEHAKSLSKVRPYSTSRLVAVLVCAFGVLFEVRPESCAYSRECSILA